MATRIPLAGDNFLVPNATFLAELLAFAIILFILAKYVIPPVNKAMTERQEKIRRQFEESEEAKRRAEAAEQEFRSQIVEARREAARIREEAREQGAAIIAEMRAEAQAESQRIIENAHAQLDAERRQVLAQLRSEVGGIATTLAGRIVGETLEDDERQRRIVDRFIAELEGQQADTTTAQAR
jgi:F-type H+-transporting ATPase subunit b